MKKIVFILTVLNLVVIGGMMRTPASVLALTEATPVTPNLSITLENPLKNTDSIQGLLGKLLDAIVLLLVPVIVVMMLYTGFLFIKAQGNGEALEVAKKSLLWTMVGAAIVLGAKGIAYAIQNTLQQF